MRAIRRLFGSLLVVTGLAVQTQGSVPAEANSVVNETITGAAKANGQFGLGLFARLRQQEGNLFFSPYSLSTALAMTYAGARGQTHDQMAKTLHWCDGGEQSTPWTPAYLAQSLGAMIKEQNRRGSQGQYEWVVANALWGHKDFAFLADFLQTIETHYGGKLHPVDFAGDPEAGRVTINTWVDDQTHGKILDLIPKGVLDRTTRLVLTNAIYFKGDWSRPFNKDRTVKAPFKLGGGKTVEGPMMGQTSLFAYADNTDLQILELPYKGDELSMVILLPRQADGLARVEQDLTWDAVTGWWGQLRGCEVAVTIPRFKVTSQFSLAETLRSMGMTDAFSGGADFSGMTGRRDLFISAVVHKAFVAVDEKGTEAAAATGAVMSLTSIAAAQPVVFRADHPFLFLIRDKVSGSILFVGRVTTPTEGT